MKRVIISVTSDLVTDQRVHKVALSLHNQGFKVTLFGRKLAQSKSLEQRVYKTKRTKLLFEKGFLFYANYNFRLFFYLLTHKADIFLANDLDTLPANFWASKISKTKLIFDSHEYFTGVPELLNRNRVRNIWKGLERYILPRIKTIYTVNDSIAAIYRKEYNKEIHVVRNMPFAVQPQYKEDQDDFGIIPASHSETAVVLNLIYETLKTEKRKIIIYQGAINKDRGIEEMIEAMQWVENAVFLLIGTGDLYKKIKNQVKKLAYNDKIVMPGSIPMQYLSAFTQLADLGISLEKPTNINYQFASPNKVVDYIHSNVPVLATRLVEIEKIVSNYQVGDFIESHHPTHIVLKINSLLNNETQMNRWKNNCKTAAKVLTWENEEKVLLELFK
ncbi:MAG: glycosyltransferase [Cytophagales bacterium]